MFKKKNQRQVHDIYSGRHRNFYLKTPKESKLPTGQARRSFWQRHSHLFGGVLKGGLTVMISVLMIYGVVHAGSLTPSASPAATMNSLADIAGSGFATATHSLKALYDWLGTNVEGVKSALTGTYDASGVSSNATGNVMEQLKFIQQNLGGYTYGSSNAGEVLTIAGGTYNATLLMAANVRSGVAFGVSSTGTYGGSGWTYGSDDASKVLTSADAAGTYNASNLSVGVVKSGTTFDVSLTGDYPSAAYTLPSADATADLAASGGNISSSNGSVEWWQSDGARQTATLDFPTLSNLCDTDTSNNSAGALSVTAAYLSVGNTWCGTAGTLLANLWNGSLTAGGFDGGSQANGGVDDYNAGNAAGRPSDTYSKGWTACNSGNSYCGTSDSGADAKDDSTGLIWSMPCNGSGCASFSDASPITYSWDNSAANNNSRTASQLCSDHAGWSLPHQKQLMQAYIDGSWGNLEGVGRYYWSATTRSDSTTYAWGTYLSYGGTHNGAKTGSDYVRCVR